MEYELYHFGVKGMKWGVRRKSDDAKNARALGRKPLNQLSNAELKQLNERKRLEREYKQLNPSMVSRGIKFVAGASAVLGTAVSVYNNTNTLTKIGKIAYKKMMTRANRKATMNRVKDGLEMLSRFGRL